MERNRQVIVVIFLVTVCALLSVGDTRSLGSLKVGTSHIRLTSNDSVFFYTPLHFEDNSQLFTKVQVLRVTPQNLKLIAVLRKLAFMTFSLHPFVLKLLREPWPFQLNNAETQLHILGSIVLK